MCRCDSYEFKDLGTINIQSTTYHSMRVYNDAAVPDAAPASPSTVGLGSLCSATALPMGIPRRRSRSQPSLWCLLLKLSNGLHLILLVVLLQT